MTLMVIGITLFALLTGTITVKVAKSLGYTRRCEFCRKKVSQDFSYCPHCGGRQDEIKDRQCGECHRHIALKDDYCPYCGAAQKT